MSFHRPEVHDGREEVVDLWTGRLVNEREVGSGHEVVPWPLGSHLAPEPDGRTTGFAASAPSDNSNDALGAIPGTFLARVEVDAQLPRRPVRGHFQLRRGQEPVCHGVPMIQFR